MTLWITHGYMLHILERNLKKCKVLGSLPVFFRVLVAVSVIQCKKRPFESLICWERWGSLLPRVVLSLMLFLFNFGSRLSRRRSMGTKRAYVTYFGKKNSKLLSFGFLACFFSSFGCSFCHPMQEETFWESYLLRKVRQLTAQCSFESYFALIQFWKSFIRTPLHWNKENRYCILERNHKPVLQNCPRSSTWQQVTSEWPPSSSSENWPTWVWSRGWLMGQQHPGHSHLRASCW